MAKSERKDFSGKYKEEATSHSAGTKRCAGRVAGIMLKYGKYLEVEVAGCIVVADILYHLAHALLFVTGEWDEPLLNVVAEKITESAAEILMTWVREE